MTRPHATTRAGRHSRGELQVSEHAVLRYIERVIGITAGEISALIVPACLAMQIAELGDGEYPIDGTHKVVVRGNIVVTVLVTGKEPD